MLRNSNSNNVHGGGKTLKGIRFGKGKYSWSDREHDYKGKILRRRNDILSGKYSEGKDNREGISLVT